MNFLSRTQGERPVYYCDCTRHPVMPFLISDTHTIYKFLMRNGPAQRCWATVSESTRAHTHTHAQVLEQALGRHIDWVILGGHTLIVLLMTKSERLSITWEHHSSRPYSIPPLRHTDIIGVLDPEHSHGATPRCLQPGFMRPSLPDVFT